MLAVESPRRTDGVAALVVRGAGTTVVVDVEQSRGENMPCAVENIRVVSDEITPAAADPRSEDAIVLEGDKGIRTVNTRTDQPDGVDDCGGGAAHRESAPVRPVAHGPGQYADGRRRARSRWRPCQTPLMAQGSGADLRDMPDRPSRHVSTEIADQPSAWARAAKLGLTERVLHALPERGQRVAVIGCGTSFYMAQSFAALRESSGHGETDAFPASEFPARRSYDTLVALTRSGTTTEVVRLLETLRNRARTRTVVITADPDTPVVELADHRWFWISPMRNQLFRHGLPPRPWHCGGPGWGRPHRCHRAGAIRLTAPLPPRTLDSAQFTFLGSGMSVGIANEAALKLREASQSWTESYPAMEFRHGPISVVGRASTVWVFGPPPAGLLEDLEVTGAHVESSDLDPMADLIRAQRLAVALAEAKDSIPTSPGTWHGQSCFPDMTAMRRVNDQNVVQRDLVIGVDVGGTTIKAAVFDSDGLEYSQRAADAQTPRPGRRHRNNHSRDPRAQSAGTGGRAAAGCGPCGPGVVDAQQGIAVYAANIGWQQLPLRQIVADAVGLPVILDHDVRAAGLAELELGAGRACRRFSSSH